MPSKPHAPLLEGERLTLSCQANEDTEEMRWTKNDVPMNRRANIYPNGSNSTLVIEKVLTSDSGIYSCMAVNKAGSSSTSVHISVTGNLGLAPILLSSTILITNGLKLKKLTTQIFLDSLSSPKNFHYQTFAATGIMPLKTYIYAYQRFQLI